MDAQLVHIQQFLAGLDEETHLALEAISQLHTYPKGELLLREGEVCHKSYQIDSGIARKYYLHDGKEITTALFFADDIAVSMRSYTLQQPSQEYIEALTEVTVSSISYHAFQEAKKKYPALLVLDLMLTEYYALWVEKRLFEVHTMNATTRYASLLADNPYIIQSVPLTIIASYLGISLETLSRIRAKRS